MPEPMYPKYTRRKILRDRLNSFSYRLRCRLGYPPATFHDSAVDAYFYAQRQIHEKDK